MTEILLTGTLSLNTTNQPPPHLYVYTWRVDITILLRNIIGCSFKKQLIVGNVFLRINTAQSISNYQIGETKSKYTVSQCAHGKSSLVRKTSVHPKFFQW